MITSKKLLELGEMSTQSEVRFAALLMDLIEGIWWLCSFICLYRSVTYKHTRVRT